MSRKAMSLDFSDVTGNLYCLLQLDQLVADIGGLLGLFIGLSICTAIEFLEFIFDLLIICCSTKSRVTP